MSGLSEQIKYKKGDNPVLDRELERYRKLRVWRGDAINQVFKDDDEFQVFGKLWPRERLGFWPMTVGDVSMLIGFGDRIRAWRAYAKKKGSSKRMARARKNLRKAAKDGDSAAMSKIRREKKSSKKRWVKYVERKRAKKAL